MQRSSVIFVKILFTTLGPESRAAAIWALGLIHKGKPDANLAAALERRFEPSTDPVPNACCWSISQLTGRAIPPPNVLRTIQRDWFLTPYERGEEQGSVLSTYCFL